LLVQCCRLHRSATSAAVVFCGGEPARRRVCWLAVPVHTGALMQRFAHSTIANLNTSSLGSQLPAEGGLQGAVQRDLGGLFTANAMQKKNITVHDLSICRQTCVRGQIEIKFVQDEWLLRCQRVTVLKALIRHGERSFMQWLLFAPLFPRTAWSALLIALRKQYAFEGCTRNLGTSLCAFR